MANDPKPAAGKRLSREVFGVFDSAESFENAATDLLVEGYEQRRLSVLAKRNTIEEKLGHRYESVTEITDGEDVERNAFVEKVTHNELKAMMLGSLAYFGGVAAAGAVVISGGTALAAGLLAVAAGGGAAAAGEALDRVLGERYATHLQDQLEHGGIALWVSVDGSDEDEARATRVLQKNGATSVVAQWIDLSHVADGNPLKGKSVDPFLNDAKI